MNYRHAFHAGNHADVLKHVVLLGAGRCAQAQGHALLRARHPCRPGPVPARRASSRTRPARPAAASSDCSCCMGCRHWCRTTSSACRPTIRSGRWCPTRARRLLVAQAMREQDRLAACELQPDEARALAALFKHDDRVNVMPRDGYGAIKALLPPKEKRGLVLIDPPYESAGSRVHQHPRRAQGRPRAVADRHLRRLVPDQATADPAAVPAQGRVAALQIGADRRIAGAPGRFPVALEWKRHADHQPALSTRSGTGAGAAGARPPAWRHVIPLSSLQWLKQEAP